MRILLAFLLLWSVAAKAQVPEVRFAQQFSMAYLQFNVMKHRGLLEKHAACDPVNIGYGRAVTIKQVIQSILPAAGHQNAELKFDTTKPVQVVEFLARRSIDQRLDQILDRKSEIFGVVVDGVDWKRRAIEAVMGDDER